MSICIVKMLRYLSHGSELDSIHAYIDEMGVFLVDCSVSALLLPSYWDPDMRIL